MARQRVVAGVLAASLAGCSMMGGSRLTADFSQRHPGCDLLSYRAIEEDRDTATFDVSYRCGSAANQSVIWMYQRLEDDDWHFAWEGTTGESVPEHLRR